MIRDLQPSARDALRRAIRQQVLRRCFLRRRVLVAIVAALALVLPASTGRAQDGDLDQHVFELARQLRCPVCVSESVADSNARVSIEMRELIQQQLEEGRSDAEILAFFQERYGDWILLEPPRRGIHLWVWLLPAIVLAVGAGALAWFVRRWLRAGRETPAVGQEDLDRVRAALASDETAGADREAGARASTPPEHRSEYRPEGGP